ncbi:MAG TPA: VWA domain-containing protein [Planktothrix sp.]|jgi:uncharacterized protein YegL
MSDTNSTAPIAPVEPVAPVAAVAPVTPAPVASAPAPQPASPASSFDLSRIDVAILVDSSGTMSESDAYPGSPLTRLAAVGESAFALAKEMEQHDPDGLTVIRFAGKVRAFDGQTSAKIKQLFQEIRPMGGTNTKEAIETVANMLLPKQKAAMAAGQPHNSICAIVFTDGEPDDKVGLAQAIVNITKQIGDRSQFGILFVQVGNDQAASAYLDKLNNHLTEYGASYDIVACCKLTDLEDMTPNEIIEQAFTA